MSGFANRGGYPFARNLTATTAGVIATAGVAGSDQAAGAPIKLPARTSWVRLAATTNGVRVYFSQADFTADKNYLAVASGAAVEAPLDVESLWLKGVGGTSSVDILAAAK